ncbi:VOC family protein [Parashewanella spongiae]|uniref:VOC family protein n=1 Tax=Parashewanella spongiae TaxID=342950 RepID=A0A3A6UA05_9GAMM|nr:VOC family protein [Parashewanella spongiae]MCL1078270.1 VOC family protein [Parashewanella spongiae]RJY18784.1 VOC family protein [Parashewanella spongiae]
MKHQSETLLTTEWLTFSTKIQSFIKRLGIEQHVFECDHVALRANSTAKADEYRNFFEERGTVISENIINGRPILIIELDEPLSLGGMIIPCVELPYPSQKRYPQEGWEHIEIVIPSNAAECEHFTADVVDIIPNLKNTLKLTDSTNSDIKIKLSSPRGTHERLANPTIALKQKDVCIKLHPHSIKDIIDSELE